MVILDIGQWLLDTVGKLGPLSVAIAVYVASRRQNAWTSGAVVRSANLEDQKMRLALLDRRLAVIQHLRTARDKASPTMQGTEALGAVLDALREAELIFEDEEQQAIKECLQTVIRYQTQFGTAFASLHDQELLRALAEYSSCVAHINRVLNALREAARIKALAPLALPRW